MYPAHPSRLAARLRSDLQRKVRDGTPGLLHLQEKIKLVQFVKAVILNFENSCN